MTCPGRKRNLHEHSDDKFEGREGISEHLHGQSEYVVDDIRHFATLIVRDEVSGNVAGVRMGAHWLGYHDAASLLDADTITFLCFLYSVSKQHHETPSS